MILRLEYLAHYYYANINLRCYDFQQVSILLTAIISIHGGVLTAPRHPRLSEAEWNNYHYKDPTGPGTYAFGYEVQDTQTSNVQYRNEEKHPNGSVTGNYGLLLPDGNVQTVNYIADQDGYRYCFKIS